MLLKLKIHTKRILKLFVRNRPQQQRFSVNFYEKLLQNALESKEKVNENRCEEALEQICVSCDLKDICSYKDSMDSNNKTLPVEWMEGALCPLYKERSCFAKISKESHF